jgi:hypothetical protein
MAEDTEVTAVHVIGQVYFIAVAVVAQVGTQAMVEEVVI